MSVTARIGIKMGITSFNTFRCFDVELFRKDRNNIIKVLEAQRSISMGFRVC